MKFGLRETIFVALLMSLPVGAWWFIFRPQNIRNDEMIKQIEVKQEKLRAGCQRACDLQKLGLDPDEIDGPPFRGIGEPYEL